MKLCTLLIAFSVAAAAIGAANQDIDQEPKVVALTTQVFESGELKMGEVSSRSLEAFLQDLNRRKDYDYSQHDGKPGPDSAYLWDWVQKVTTELQQRGYYIDKAGALHRPGEIVAWR